MIFGKKAEFLYLFFSHKHISHSLNLNVLKTQKAPTSNTTLSPEQNHSPKPKPS